jgi:hypothetical protein
MWWFWVLLGAVLLLIFIAISYVKGLVEDIENKYEKYEIKKAIEYVKNKEKK